jgi:hypothetical protein
MNEFWLWFWRPIAELLGSLAMLAAVAAVMFAFLLAGVASDSVKAWWKRRANKAD